MDIKNAISKDLSIPEQFIDEAIKVARIHVKIFNIPAKSGGQREIFHPSKKLKTIQYWLIHNVFNKMYVHESSMAYKKETSTLLNASKHKDNRFFLRIDLEKFFPSISFQDLHPYLKDWHSTSKPRWDLDSDAMDLIRNVCFYKDDKLAIGYPCSPVISNIVMANFDKEVVQLVSKEQYGKAVYTRYADDMVFSTNVPNACQAIKKEIFDLIRNNASPQIAVNFSKTKTGSSTGGSASVTGLKILTGGNITIHKEQKNHIRLLLSLFKKGVLAKEDEKKLIGHLSYIQHVAPDFYSKMQNKYFKEIYELRKTK